MDDHHPTDPSTLAGRTLARIEEAMATGENQCLPELMEIIHALSAKATEISVEQLADLVEKHIAVMAKVIASANTFGFNPGGADITNVRDAIQVIGFERIRSLVTSLILVRHAADADATRDQRSTALLAVTSGLLARSIARERDIADPELAFVAASLRQLGRLLLCAYLPEDYKAACARAAEVPEAGAFEERFGLGPLALTREILRRAHFPQRLLDTLYDHQARPAGRRSPEAQALVALSSFSERLCSLAVDARNDETRFAKSMEELARGFDNRLHFDKEQLEAALGNIGDGLAQFTRSMGFGNIAQDNVATLRWRGGRGPAPAKYAAAKPAAEGKAPAPNGSRPPLPAAGSAAVGTPPPAGSGKLQAPSQTGPAATERPSQTDGEDADAAGPARREPSRDGDLPAHEQAAPETTAELHSQHWKDGLVSLSTLLGDNTIDMNAVYSLAMDFVRQGFRAPEALVLRLEPDQRHYSASHGVGAVFKRIRGENAVKKDERTVFGIAISRRENVLIHNTSDPKITPYLPAWCSAVGGWGAFIAIPLCEQTSCYALLLIAWPRPLQIQLTAENGRLLRSLLATVGAARRLSHSA